MMKQSLLAAGLAASLALAGVLPAGAQEPYKIGVSAGLTGYAATVDRAWRDGVELAAAALNAKGGVMGRKIQVVVEDNRSEPQEAVTVYRKMLSSDKVDVFVSGCVSAGNFAAAGLLQRAGFALPVADSETIEVEYDNALALMRDLGAMGESNLVAERRRGLARRATLLRAAEIYGERFALPSGRVAASFEVLFLHGWAPHESQPKPLRPGSAAQRLADALGTAEQSAGEKAGRG